MASRGFYLVSDFHADMNFLASPSHVHGEILYARDKKRDRVVQQIYNWLGIPRDRLLVFSGDTSNSLEVTSMVLEEASERIRQILFCPGNHEYYYPARRPMSEVDDRLRSFSAGHPNIKLMEPGIQHMEEDVLYLGCTGWYNWDAIPHLSREDERHVWMAGNNDSRAIMFDRGYPDRLAYEHVEWLLTAVDQAQSNPAVSKIVIFTHMCPRPEFLVGPDHEWYLMNGSYTNTWMTEVPHVDTNKKIAVWAYGHTHFHNDIVVDGIRYVCNARGYAKEFQNRNWAPKWIEF